MPYTVDTIFQNLPGRDAFKGADILNVAQFEPQNLTYIMALASRMREVVKASGGIDLLKFKIMTALFYEPSTRTSSSFIAAMARLGGSVIPITQGVQFSSVSKGETLADTVRTLAQYADAIVLRHPQIGAAQQATQYSPVPILNAGDGAGEHPTQALLDLFTIADELGTLDGITVAMVGDLRFGRTVHSLTKLLLNYDVKFRFVSPEILRMPLAITNKVRKQGAEIEETYDVREVIGDVDVLYVTRVQRERFTDLSQYEEVKNYYIVDPELMQQAKKEMVVMHPLPRVGEISESVDPDPRAAYFRQAQNGLYIRMALLAAVLANR